MTRQTSAQRRKRILFLAHRIPYPPDKGDKIRSWQELKALARDHDVTLACFIDDPADEKHVPTLERHCREVVWVPLRALPARLRSLGALFGRGSLSLAYYRSRALRERLRGRTFDAVFAFSSTMGPYADLFPDARRVLDLCDLDSRKMAQFAPDARFPMSWIYRTEAARLGRYEREAAESFDATILVSETECNDLRAACPKADILAIPNGVDLAYYDPGATPVQGDGRTAVFCGAMDYKSNVDAVQHFCRDILPLVREQMPDARFKIVGSNPSPEVLRLGESAGVEVTGRVPDVRPEILSCAVSVAPLRLGRGVPNKVLEALALSLPVVATPNAAAGLSLEDFDGADIAADAPSFARAVVDRLRAAKNGSARFPQHRRVLGEKYNWDRHMEKLRQVLSAGA